MDVRVWTGLATIDKIIVGLVILSIVVALVFGMLIGRYL